MHTPDSNASPSGTELTTEAKRKRRTAVALRTAITQVVAAGDARAAALLAEEASDDHAGDETLTPIVFRCKELGSRAGWLDVALTAMRRDLEEDRFASGVGHFREALGVSRGFKLLKAEVDEAAEEQAQKLLPQNWRIAETLLQEAAATEPVLKIDSDLRAKLKQAREAEALTNAIYQTDRAHLEGKTQEARGQLAELLAAHPADARISERIQAIDHPGDTKRVAEVAAPVSEPKAATKPRPPDSELDTEGTPNENVKPGWPRVLVAHATWNAFKNFSALGTATAMLGLAGILVWHHVSGSGGVSRTNGVLPPSLKMTSVAVKGAPVKAPEGKPVALAEIKTVESPEEEAWALVKRSNDAVIIEAFLSTYPTSVHVYRAQVKLEAMEWTKVDKTSAEELGVYLQLHPKAVHRQEAERLLLELNPEEATVPVTDKEAILEAVRAFRKGRPQPLAEGSDGVLEEPVIEGDEAKLLYRAQGPTGAINYTFMLLRQDGGWKVQSVR